MNSRNRETPFSSGSPKRRLSVRFPTHTWTPDPVVFVAVRNCWQDGACSQFKHQATPYIFRVLLYEYIQSNDGRTVDQAVAEHPRYSMNLVQKPERILAKQIQ